MTGLPSRTSRLSYGPALLAGKMRDTDGEKPRKREHRPSTLAESYAWCRRFTRASRSNFYLSFLTLPRSLFCDLCALYAFMRVSDDLGDDATLPEQQRFASVEQWKVRVAEALDGSGAAGGFEHPVLPALTDVVRRHRIPSRYLVDVIDGVKSDLTPRIFETFADLSDYCYHVAGAVGLCCLHIWGFTDERAKDLAIDCGLAFQLTNILRDVAEDARVGRYYLPREDLARFGLTNDNLRTGQPPAAFRDLMAYEAARARNCFVRAADLVPLCSPVGRPILDTMLRTYGALLNAIETSSYDVHARRIRVGLGRKTQILLGSLWRYRRGVEGPDK
jgi:phytoene synthase